MEIIVIKDLSQKYECPLCFNFVESLENTCQKKIDGHNICLECNRFLKDKNKYGLKDSGCIYCGDRSEKKIIEIVTPVNNNINQINQIIISGNNSERNCYSFSKTIRNTVICFGFCIIFNMLFCLVRFLHHKITKQDHTHKISLSIDYIFYGASILSCNFCISVLLCYCCINIDNSPRINY